MKTKLNIYWVYESNKHDSSNFFYFAAIDDSTAARYINILEEKEGKRYSNPEKVGIIKIDPTFRAGKRDLYKEGDHVLKLGKLETDMAIG